MSDLKTLRAEHDQTWNVLRDAQASHLKAEEAYHAALAESIGLRVGMLVRGSEENVFKVSDFTVFASAQCVSSTLYGYKKLKDGSFGSQRRYIGSRWLPYDEAQP